MKPAPKDAGAEEFPGILEIQSLLWARRLTGLYFCGRIVTENIFFSEGDKVVLGKVFELWFSIFKRKDLPDKFIGRSLGDSRPYPAAPVSELM